VEGFIPQFVNICLMMLMELEHDKVVMKLCSCWKKLTFGGEKRNGSPARRMTK
jgi:hypothetical protein